VHVPHEHEWSFEAADTPTGHHRFHLIVDLGELPALVDQIRGGPHK
jgi:hypothetical protein